MVETDGMSARARLFAEEEDGAFAVGQAFVSIASGAAGGTPAAAGPDSAR